MDNNYWDLAAKQLEGKASPAEQAELNRWLDGEWEIQQIVFTANGKGSVATAPIGIFYIERC